MVYCRDHTVRHAVILLEFYYDDSYTVGKLFFFFFSQEVNYNLQMPFTSRCVMVA